MPQIRHIILLMMENHSFDNYFGTLGHGEGFTHGPDGAPLDDNPSRKGPDVRVHHLTSTTQSPGVPSQAWHASYLQWNHGENDGFVTSLEDTQPGKDAKTAMGYWNAEDLPFYSGLAKTFALADHWFCSCLGPTFPNRRFLLAATANGLIDDIPLGMIDYPRSGTIFDLLARHNISWVNYHHTRSGRVFFKRLLGGAGLRGGRGIGLAASRFFPSMLKQARGNLQFTANLYPLGLFRCVRHLRSIERFWRDVEQGTLPAVSIVDPDFQSCSEENPQDIHAGEGFAAEVINRVMTGKGWPNTVLIWFYDENGGYYDHVKPDPAPEPDKVLPRSLLTQGGAVRWLLKSLGFLKKIQNIDSGVGRYDRFGFRVPAVVVSPYSKPGHVSHTPYDHTSALKLIELKWNLPPLTERDRAATAPLDMIDLSRAAFLSPPSLPSPAQPWPTT